MYISYLIHLQALRESIFGHLWFAASLNKQDPACSTLSSPIVGRGLIVDGKIGQTLIKKSDKVKWVIIYLFIVSSRLLIL